MPSTLSLEEAIGRDAVLKLRDWLIAEYPADETSVRATVEPQVLRNATVSAVARARFDAVHGDAHLEGLARLEARAREAKPPRFYAEPYKLRGRDWFRVIDRGTGRVAGLPIRQGREFVKQELFMTMFEAAEAIDRLHVAFNLPGASTVSPQA